MVRHVMDIIIMATAKLNGNQMSVYAIGKELQWKFPDKYSEDHIIFMKCGLHSEMMVINLLARAGARQAKFVNEHR
ncbi:Hypothetical predicted protein [Podarcis lilfordi]|uniref:Uncharacterized protein n=1 Tax=Podarcis lilfordi TaxID=74358 RepID=A0AA35PS38_9SAUR|nr:Hypothetical predicted protein [Podarcis lilfordi]